MSIHILGITMRASILDTVHFSLFFVLLVQKALFLCFHFHGNPHFGINIDMFGCGKFVLMVCMVVVRIDFSSSPYSSSNHSKLVKQKNFAYVHCRSLFWKILLYLIFMADGPCHNMYLYRLMDNSCL